MQEIKIEVGNREYTINNNNGKYDRAKKDAGENASPEQILAHYDKLAGLIKDENGNKVENGRFWETEKKRFIEKVIYEFEGREKFHSNFLKYLEGEKSNYAKLILQENLIAYEITSLLFLIQSVINVDCISNASDLLKTNIWIKFSPKDLQEQTLGKLIHVLETFLNDSDLISNLKKFNGLRNNIIHKVFYKYESMSDLHNEAVEVTESGESILNKLKIRSNDIVDLTKTRIK